MSVNISRSSLLNGLIVLAALASSGKASAETHSFQDTCREVTTSYNSGRVIHAICRMNGDNALAERFTQLNLAPGVTCDDISNINGFLRCYRSHKAFGTRLPPGSKPY